MAKWIVCAGIPRSGSTLQYQIIKAILDTQTEVLDIGWLGNNNIYQVKQEFDSKKSYILLKTHNHIEGLERMIDKDKIIVFVTYRDIRDVFCSLMNMSKLNFEHVFSKLKLEEILQNFNLWLNYENLYTRKYEQFVNNIEDEIFLISDFLKIQLDSKDINNLKSKLLIKNQKQIISRLNAGEYDSNSLLHSNHIYSGKINQWKEKLTKEQIGIIQSFAKNWLIKYGYTIEPTIYNFKPIWRIRKITRHIKNGTLIHRIKESSNEKSIESKRKFLYGNKGFKVFKLSKNLKLKLHSDSKLSEYILFSDFEKIELEFIEKYLAEGDVFIDVGANVGIFTLLGSQEVGDTGKVYSIEPTNKIFNRLKENIILNNLTNIDTYQLALSNKNGHQVFYENQEGYDAWNSLYNPSIGKLNIPVDIETKTLDTFIMDASIEKVDLIKIDAEGAEYNILEGGKSILSMEEGPDLLVEFTQENLQNANKSLKQLYDLGLSLGYKWYEFDSIKKIAIETNFNSEIKHQNLIASKNVHKLNRRLT